MRQVVLKRCVQCRKPFVAFGRSPQFCSDRCRKARKAPWRKVVLAVVLVVAGSTTAWSDPVRVPSRTLADEVRELREEVEKLKDEAKTKHPSRLGYWQVPGTFEPDRNGDLLLRECTNTYPNLEFCNGYISGTLDTLQMKAVSEGKARANCAPKNSFAQLRDAVVAKLRKDPEKSHSLPAVNLITVALFEAFPCR